MSRLDYSQKKILWRIMTNAVKLSLEGRVQGVGFRHFVYQKALQLDIKGYVKNLYDGSIEILAMGDKQNMHDFIMLAMDGPSRAEVMKISYEDIFVSKEYNDFTVSY